MTLYSNRLSTEIEEDVLDALEQLAVMPRKEYEPALPDLGTLLSMVECCGIARRNRENIAGNKALFYFDCAHCGLNESGYFAPSEPAVQKRLCKSHYGPVGSGKMLPWGTICGHEMKIEQFKPFTWEKFNAVS